ncbi:VCBS repeat-containing protein [Streptomyces murinus]|uniref:VCBS repeat-containing protein n=1 Tax=Streptomyces murinus TaxID=33900 RepID=UPI000A376A91|nr:VCBS repeat-containing protein [Streptomyces murinus]
MHLHRRLALATATAAALTGGLLTFAAAPATAADSTRVAKADFNGDGIGDLATSAATAYVSGHKNAGAVVVMYGSKTGVSAAGHTLLTQNTAGVPGGAEAGDEFGGDLAYADFNGDGYDDLAVGTPDEKVDSDTDGGAVAILWGSKSGLTGKGVNVADPAPASHDYWGETLAAGDFDGDGKADLAVGSSNSTLYLYRGGFTTAGKPGSRTTVKAPIRSGTAGGAHGPLNLTAGDVNGDGRTDLVVDGYETRTSHGWNTNYWLPGAATGLNASAAKALKPGIITAIGDVNGDGYQDLVISAPEEDLDGVTNTGMVTVLYGSASGVNTASGAQSFAQSTTNVPGQDEKNDLFGTDVKLDDVTGDGKADLMVGSYENGGDGAVTYLPSDGRKITAIGSRAVSPASAGVSTTGVPQFGSVFAD